eukprot:GHVL01006267.1.p1 GENE.GHVL01006267.1~~GHVL01006267.1.p1  ORF type:complete len:657 (-),score=175.88 GHVL01006267.1:93-2063(-)
MKSFFTLASILTVCFVKGNLIEYARLYGDIHRFAYYFVDILIGTPPQRQSVIADTGSTIIAFPCKNCDHCGTHLDSPFDFEASDTSEWQKCSAGCSPCRNDRCSYHQSYTEGSAIDGYWFSDLVALGDACQRNLPVRSYMGCHSDENRLFYTQKASGIMGLAFARQREHKTLIDNLFEHTNEINKNVFSMCLADHGGLLSIGGWNSTMHIDDNIVWTKIVDHIYYTVELKEGRIGDDSLLGRGSWGRTIVDSGTTFTYLPTDMYNLLINYIQDHCNNTNLCGIKRDSGRLCYEVSEDHHELSDYPDVLFVFHGYDDKEVSWIWKASSYMYEKGSNILLCIAIDDNGRHGGTVLGASFMINTNVIFDRDNDRVGLVRAKCPTFNKRPDAPKEDAWDWLDAINHETDAQNQIINTISHDKNTDNITVNDNQNTDNITVNDSKNTDNITVNDSKNTENITENQSITGYENIIPEKVTVAVPPEEIHSETFPVHDDETTLVLDEVIPKLVSDNVSDSVINDSTLIDNKTTIPETDKSTPEGSFQSGKLGMFLIALLGVCLVVITMIKIIRQSLTQDVAPIEDIESFGGKPSIIVEEFGVESSSAFREVDDPITDDEYDDYEDEALTPQPQSRRQTEDVPILQPPPSSNVAPVQPTHTNLL